jgi:sugar phosphate isomerase/epimerase
VDNNRIFYSVFTKPWKTTSLAKLGEFVHGLGFNGIELPVRPGYQVQPEDIGMRLPQAVKILEGCGVKVFSVAGPTDEAAIAACAEAGVPIIRICLDMPAPSYRESETLWRKEWDALVPLLERYGVTLGIQNHSGRSASNASSLRALLQDYDPKHIAAVWDAAHNALQGEEPEIALDIIWPHLCMVNLKNAFWQRTNGPEADQADWRPHWTLGRHGLASWPRAVAELKRRSYSGVVCLTAEYSETGAADRLIAEDVGYAKGLFG